MDTELSGVYGGIHNNFYICIDQPIQKAWNLLNILRDFNLDMSKIQSMPIIESPWKYSFFIDVTFENYDEFLKAVGILEVMTEQLTILGTYKNSLIC